LSEVQKLFDLYPDSARLLFLTRDPDVWGDLANRKIRITPFASYGPIQEAFCEYWMTSILYPELLTQKKENFSKKFTKD